MKTRKSSSAKKKAGKTDESLKPAYQHGLQKHGTAELPEDIDEGIRPKNRDLKSPQIRGHEEPDAEEAAAP